MDIYFIPDFSIVIDGIDLDRSEFLSRIQRMRRETMIEKQEFIEMMEEGASFSRCTS